MALSRDAAFENMVKGGSTTGWIFVYRIQPVAKPVIQPVSQPVVSCKRYITNKSYEQIN